MHSGMQGAPVIDNNWGDLTAMLRACCVTGFNVRPIQSITCQGTKATIQCAGHGYVEHQVVQIENATPAGYNGAHRVVSVESANTLTIELETELPEAQAAPGQTLQMRTAPLGWESLFDDGGQKLVLRSTDVQSTRNVLRVDDSCPAGYTTTWAKFGRVTMAQDMTDLDTFVGARAPFDPTDPTKNEVPKGSGGNMRSGWYKWYFATHGVSGYSESATPARGTRLWALWGDGRTFYLGCDPAVTNRGLSIWHSGDIDSLQTPDPFACLLTAIDDDNEVNRSNINVTRGSIADDREWPGHLLLRDYIGEGLPVRCVPRSLKISNSGSFASGTDSGLVYPNGPGNGLLLHPVWVHQENKHLRGKLRGVQHVLHKADLGHLAVIDGVAGAPDRRFMLSNVLISSTSAGSLAIDLTGPW